MASSTTTGSQLESSEATAIEVSPGRWVPAWVVLALVCVGQFMVVLDISIVNVALPSIQRDLGFNSEGLQWIVNAYTLTFAGFLLLGGRAADLFGRRRIFMIGLAGFAVASLLGGAAQSQAMLVTARAVQGLCAAVLAPATLTILTASFSEGRARARALGVWSAVSAAGASAGALLGGILTDLLNWRWILFVNVPIGILALVGARRFLPESRAESAHRHLDVPGAVLVTAGLVVLVYSIVRTQTYTWGSPHTLVPLGIAVVLLAMFLLREARWAKAPLVPLGIFRSRSVAGGNAVMLLLFAAMFGSWYFETLYMQGVLHFSPLQAGLAFLPQTLIIILGAQITARWVTRLGPRPLIMIGAFVGAVGLAWLSRITPTSTFLADLLAPFLLIGLGMGLTVTPVTVAATAGVPRENAGLASGLLNTSRTIGASIGLAALATVAADRSLAVLASHSHKAVALTDGYSLALVISALILFTAGIVAMATLPPLRRRQETISYRSTSEPAGALGEAFESA